MSVYPIAEHVRAAIASTTEETLDEWRPLDGMSGWFVKVEEHYVYLGVPMGEEDRRDDLPHCIDAGADPGSTETWELYTRASF
jgi:hypothetical protein